MHWHNVRQEPDNSEKAYCDMHAKLWIKLGDMMEPCDCDRGEMQGCDVCLEEW
jgi:hypothetical protein